MKVLSRNTTLFWRVFFPTFWMVFFGCFILATFLIGAERSSLLGSTSFRMGIIAFYVAGILLLLRFPMRLKRVEIDDHFIYVSDFFKTARYPFSHIKKVVEKDFLIFHPITIYLDNKGIFGDRVTFLSRKDNFETHFASRPDLHHLVARS